ncbi:hypothetical protein ACIRJM_09205 [Streptomyces sp. NPDC102405]|uniref:hypothetical protein n=1 Tax=Streptomyces sp. NPDC102405 TaxID=3366170 RepID=UPI003816B396
MKACTRSFIGDREIDPSLPHALKEEGGNGVTAWSPPLISIEPWPPALPRLQFDYDSPTVSTIHHPGLSNVRTIGKPETS